MTDIQTRYKKFLKWTRLTQEQKDEDYRLSETLREARDAHKFYVKETGDVESYPGTENYYPECLERHKKHLLEIEESVRLAIDSLREKRLAEYEQVKLPDPEVKTEEEQPITFYYESQGKFYDSVEDVPIGQMVLAHPCLVAGGRTRYKRKTRQGKKKNYKRKTNLRPGAVEGRALGLVVPRPKKPLLIKDVWRRDIDISSNSGGIVLAYSSIRDPQALLNGNGSFVRAVKQASLYDEYKVIRCTYVFECIHNDLKIGKLRMAVDYDSVPTAAPTFSELRDDDTMVEYTENMRQIKFVVEVPDLNEGITSAGSPDDTAIIHQGGFLDFASPPINGYTAIAGEFFTASTAVLSGYVEWEVIMRRRRTIELAKKAKKEEPLQGITPEPGGSDDDSPVMSKKIKK